MHTARWFAEDPYRLCIKRWQLFCLKYRSLRQGWNAQLLARVDLVGVAQHGFVRLENHGVLLASP